MANPANADGEITSASFWFNTAASGVRVGTYYLVSGTTFKCRDSAAIGAVTAGSKQTFTQDSSGNPLSLEVHTGDFIGWYVTGGNLEKDSSGTGIYYVSGEYIDPGDQASFTQISGYGVSIYGQSSGSSANLLSYVAAERVKDGSGNTRQETLYYYDGNNTSVTTPPTKGNLTRTERKKGDGSSISTYATYDSYGNTLTETDGNGNVWQTAWETTYHTFPQTITSPITSQYETYSFNAGTGNLLSRIDVNAQSENYTYDTFGRLSKVIKPGDDATNPTVSYQYNNYGTLNQQHLKTLTRLSGTDYRWQSQYFDGLGRVIQTHARGETSRTIIESTTVYNNRGLVDKEYVSQNLATSGVSGYKDPGVRLEVCVPRLRRPGAGDQHD